MKQNNLVKILIPIVALVVVVESVVLVSSLNKKTTTSEVLPTGEVITKTPVANDQPVVDFIFETESKEMKVGKSYKVNLNLTGKLNASLDAMEIYIKYDPAKLSVTNLVGNKDLPALTKNSGIDAKSGLISSMFLWELGEVGSIQQDETELVLSFMVTPKVEGETEISLNTGSNSEKSVTIIVENSTSESLTFLGNKLEINATK